MRIEFVNHASFIVDSAGIRLICDPWLEGAAFDNSWALLSPTKLQVSDFADITHLWFSHEHPDHFHPPSLKKIPEEHRKRITVLFQETRDRKVVEWCTKLGFKEVRELPPNRWQELAPGVTAYCSPFEKGFQDSWLCLRTPEGSVLNLNDCGAFERDQVRAIKQVVGVVDVLATQFSISAWDGNPEDLERRRAGARSMLDRAVMQCQELHPRYVIPFASFIWFCHEENFYMNEAFLPLAEVLDALRSGSNALPIMMYPGDAWQLGDAWSSDEALAKYQRDVESIPTRPLHPTVPVDAETLEAASRQFCINMAEGSHPGRLRLAWASMSAHRAAHSAPIGRVKRFVTIAKHLLDPEPALLHVSDLQQSYRFHPARGLLRVDLPAQDCDMVLTADALHRAFKFLWGGQTLLINGRFRETFPDSRLRMMDYFHMAGGRNFGQTLSWDQLPRDILRWTGLQRSGRSASVSG